MIDFPSSPVAGQTFSAAGVSWTFDGVKWAPFGMSVAYLPLTGGTLSGPLAGTSANFSGLATLAGADPNSGQVSISDPVGNFGCYITSVKAGRYRWQIALGDGGPETGSNVGSDFGILLWNDNNSATFSPLSIQRATGNASFHGALSVAAGLSVTGTISATSNVDGWDYHVGGTLFCDNAGASNTMAGNLVVEGGTLQISPNGSIVYMYGGSGIYSDSGYFMEGHSGDPRGSGQWKFYYVKSTGARIWCDYTDAAIFQITPGGTCYCPGGFFTGSDAAGKRDIEPATVGLDVLRQITPAYFYRLHGEPPADQPGWKVPDRRELGLIAQDVQAALPEAVVTHAMETESTLAIEPMSLIAALINAVKELDGRLAAVEAAR